MKSFIRLQKLRSDRKFRAKINPKSAVPVKGWDHKRGLHPMHARILLASNLKQIRRENKKFTGNARGIW